MLSSSTNLLLTQHIDILRLIRHMEYVATVMRKRMHAQIFEANKPVFMQKILDQNEVQYGYQNEK